MAPPRPLSAPASQADDPRRLGSALAPILRALLPPPSRAFELIELTTRERVRLYELAQLSPHERLRMDLALARHFGYGRIEKPRVPA